MQAAIWLYPWDLLDGGSALVLDDIAQRGVTAVHLAACYHSVLALLPHNPCRRTYLADRAAIYFHSRPEFWRECELVPTISPLLLEQGDALAAAGAACRERGLRLVAWTVCLHNTDLGLRYPAVNIVNVRGEGYRYSLCPAHPQVRTYLRALVRDLRDRVDAIELESPHWIPFPHHQHAKLGIPVGAAARFLLNVCFCEHCGARTMQAGVDPEGLRARLAKRLDELLANPMSGSDDEQIGWLVTAEPDLEKVMTARRETVTSLMAELVEQAGATPIYIMPSGPDWLTGVDRAHVARLVERLEVLAYGSPSAVAAATREALGQAADAGRLAVGLSLLSPETPDRETCLVSVRAAREAGAQNICFYNYGLASLERLGWMQAALKDT